MSNDKWVKLKLWYILTVEYCAATRMIKWYNFLKLEWNSMMLYIKYIKSGDVPIPNILMYLCYLKSQDMGIWYTKVDSWLWEWEKPGRIEMEVERGDRNGSRKR